MAKAEAAATAWTVIIQDWQPTLKNKLKSGCRWWAGAKLKAADRATVAAHFRLACVPPATGKRRVSLLVVLGRGQRGGDVDAYWLSLLDALKKCGAIKDDSRNWCEIVPVRYERAARMRCEIVLEDIP